MFISCLRVVFLAKNTQTQPRMNWVKNTPWWGKPGDTYENDKKLV